MKKIVSVVLYYFIAASLSAQELSEGLAGRYRQEGASAQAQGRLMDARNAWYKYLAVQQLDPHKSDSEEIARIKKWMAELAPAPVAAVAKDEDVQASIAPATAAPVAKPVRLSAKELSKKAEMLRRNGQLDDALRFYKLAQDADPGSEEIKRAISELNAEMN